MLTNKLLTRLPDQEFSRLLPFLEPTALSGGERLSRSGEATPYFYFSEGAVLSYHSDMQDGRSVEVGMIGREGVAGLATLFGQRPAAHSLTVAVAGSALRMRKGELEREFVRNDALRQLLLSYADEYVVQVSQRFACAVLHAVEQRFAVWLLLLTDRTGAAAVEITHERIAQHLGIRRAGVTVVAGEMQARGIISYTRGNLHVTRREALEAAACECYRAMSSSQHQISYQ